MARSDLTKIIETLDGFEKRLAVSLKGLSAYVDYGYEDDGDGDVSVSVLGELHPQSGEKIKEDIQICVTIYDKDDRVVGTSNAYVDFEDFYSFEAFEISVYVPVRTISKIKVYPKK